MNLTFQTVGAYITSVALATVPASDEFRSQLRHYSSLHPKDVVQYGCSIENQDGTPQTRVIFVIVSMSESAYW